MEDKYLRYDEEVLKDVFAQLNSIITENKEDGTISSHILLGVDSFDTSVSTNNIYGLDCSNRLFFNMSEDSYAYKAGVLSVSLHCKLTDLLTKNLLSLMQEMHKEKLIRLQVDLEFVMLADKNTYYGGRGERWCTSMPLEVVSNRNNISNTVVTLDVSAIKKITIDTSNLTFTCGNSLNLRDVCNICEEFSESTRFNHLSLTDKCFEDLANESNVHLLSEICGHMTEDGVLDIDCGTFWEDIRLIACDDRNDDYYDYDEDEDDYDGDYDCDCDYDDVSLEMEHQRGLVHRGLIKCLDKGAHLNLSYSLENITASVIEDYIFLEAISINPFVCKGEKSSGSILHFFQEKRLDLVDISAEKLYQAALETLDYLTDNNLQMQADRLHEAVVATQWYES